MGIQGAGQWTWARLWHGVHTPPAESQSAGGLARPTSAETAAEGPRAGGDAAGGEGRASPLGPGRTPVAACKAGHMPATCCMVTLGVYTRRTRITAAAQPVWEGPQLSAAQPAWEGPQHSPACVGRSSAPQHSLRGKVLSPAAQPAREGPQRRSTACAGRSAAASHPVLGPEGSRRRLLYAG